MRSVANRVRVKPRTKGIRESIHVRLFREWHAANKERPPDAWIETKQNGIEIYSPYHVDFIDTLKASIPHGERIWVSALSETEPGYWWISNEYAEQAVIIFRWFFEEEPPDGEDD